VVQRTSKRVVGGIMRASKPSTFTELRRPLREVYQARISRRQSGEFRIRIDRTSET